MTKLPSFQFYPGDWMKDPSLRRCTKAAKGVWIDMICLSFECEERGVFASSGEPWPDSDIAAAVGGDSTEVLHAIDELLAKGVCSRNSSGAIFCRRVVRDEQKRRLCSEAGKRGGGNPDLTYKGDDKGDPKGASKGAPKPVPKASSSISSSSSSSTSNSKKPAPPKEPISTDDYETHWGLVAERMKGYGLARVTSAIQEAKKLVFNPQQILEWFVWLEDPAFPLRKEKIGPGAILDRIRTADAPFWAADFGWPPLTTDETPTGTVIDYPYAKVESGSKLTETEQKNLSRLEPEFGPKLDALTDMDVFALMGPQRAKFGEINIELRRKDPRSRLTLMWTLEKRHLGKLANEKKDPK